MKGCETELMLKGYGLTTAEIFYHMPDYIHVLNTFIWQEYDLAPDHPKLFDFIEFWQREIEGPLHSVKFTHRKMIAPGEWRNVAQSAINQQPSPLPSIQRQPHLGCRIDSIATRDRAFQTCHLWSTSLALS